MSMPLEIVLVRHGESEGNIVQRAFKDGKGMDIPPNFLDYHDADYRLSPEGIRQAQITGEWLRQEYGPIEDAFNEHYVSPHLRTRETAAYIGGAACSWLVDNRLIERDWGIYNSVTPQEREKLFGLTQRIRDLTPLRWRPDGGESLTSEVLLRWRDWLDTLSREQADERVIAVTHGELMWVARFDSERMLPEEWEASDEDKSQRIYNTAVMQLSRVNPDDPEDIRKSIPDGWRRITCPWNPDFSPFGGEWVKLPGKRRFNGDQLLEMVERKPRIFPGVETQEAIP